MDKPDVNNAQKLSQEVTLRAWQRTLRTKPDEARQIIDDTIERLRAGGIRHWDELSRYRAQMRNGAAVPSDFSHNARA